MNKSPQDVAIAIIVLAAIVLCSTVIFIPFRLPHVDGQSSPEVLAKRVKSQLGMNLKDLENSLALEPIVTGEEPFMLTYRMPLTIDASTMSGYFPTNESARRLLLTLEDNGKSADAYGIDPQTNGAYLVKWNTTFAANGMHTLQVRLHFVGALSRDAVYGPKQIETVTNILQWEYAGHGFGRWTTFYGWLQVTSASYSILIYNTNKSLMQRIDGHTDKGLIDEVWKVHPTNKYAWSDDDLEAKVYITPTITDANGQAKSNAPTVCVPYP